LTNGRLAILCGIAGGFAGYAAFFFLATHGYYGMILPGGLLGVGAGMVRSRSIGVPILCGVLALLLGLVTQFRYAPFNADPSLGYFVTHLRDLPSVTLGMIGLGAVIGFWVPFRRLDRSKPSS
jgi:hypothetical protein